MVIATTVSFYIVVELTQSHWKTILQPIWIALKSALIAGLPVVVVLYVFRQEIAGIQPWLILISAGLILVTLYILSVLMNYPQLYGQLRSGFQQVLKK